MVALRFSRLILGRILDAALAVSVLAAFVPMRLYRFLGVERMRITSSLVRRLGVFPLINHYYEPLFVHEESDRPGPRIRGGIELNLSDQLSRLALVSCRDELLRLRWDSPSGVGELQYSSSNGSFEAGDADLLYSIVRRLQPRRVIEVGAGNSTLIVRAALQRNATQGHSSLHTCIEPYEMPWLANLDVKLLRLRVQDVDLSVFRELERDDLLFIDSSHMVRPGGDILFELFEILPELQPGVVIHVHDIFTPRDYPTSWRHDHFRFWNEQYVLEALLSYSQRYEILFALNWLKESAFERVSFALPYVQRSSQPGSFYIRVSDPDRHKFSRLP